MNTHIKTSILILALTAAAAPSTNAATIGNLFDTGVTNANAPLVGANLNTLGVNGVLDSHFTTTPGTQAYTFDDFPPYHTEASISARWISTATNINGVLTFQEGSDTVYDYTETFSLSDLIASSAVISGSWASDNCAEVFLNGSPTGQTVGGGISSSTCTVSSANFTGLSTFLINSSNATFNAGSNTLDFRVYNQSGFTALLVTGIQGSASAAAPEPSSVLLMLTGCSLLGAAFGIGSIRRRSAANRA